MFARGIPNGPDEDLGEMRTVLVGVLACARDRVVILTPYFLPDDALTEALNVAALRGVQVDIVLPEANNLALVKWASTAMLFQVLERELPCVDVAAAVRPHQANDGRWRLDAVG